MSMMNLSTLSPETMLAANRASQIGVDKAEASVKKAANDAKGDAALTKAAQDFEAVFLTEMLKPMFEGLEVDSTFGGGKGEEVFRGFMLDEYGKEFARRGGVGLASHIKDALIQMQNGPQKVSDVEAMAAERQAARTDGLSHIGIQPLYARQPQTGEDK
ncbi:MAG: rod-binding protein [Pseudobdellovibrionaceae bacterium]